MNRHRAGVATVLALSFIALMSMALTAMMWRIKEEAGSVRAEKRAAELRQLLMAGAAAAPRLLSAPEANPGFAQVWELPIPPTLSARGGYVGLRRLATDRPFERLVEVRAQLEGVVIRQTLRYALAQQGWGLMGAELDYGRPVPGPTS